MRGAGLLLFLWAAVVSAQSQPGGFDQAFDGEERPWREIEAQLPAYPRPEKLLQFDPGGATANRYFMDFTSLLNSNGHVVGVVTGIVNPTEDSFFIGIGFAVPINVAAGGGGGLPPY